MKGLFCDVIVNRNRLTVFVSSSSNCQVTGHWGWAFGMGIGIGIGTEMGNGKWEMERVPQFPGDDSIISEATAPPPTHPSPNF